MLLLMLSVYLWRKTQALEGVLNFVIVDEDLNLSYKGILLATFHNSSAIVSSPVMTQNDEVAKVACQSLSYHSARTIVDIRYGSDAYNKLVFGLKFHLNSVAMEIKNCNATKLGGNQNLWYLKNASAECSFNYKNWQDDYELMTIECGCRLGYTFSPIGCKHCENSVSSAADGAQKCLCKDGYYFKNDIETCVKCPSFFGAELISDVYTNLCICPAGYEFSNGSCILCSAGYYSRGESVCYKCPALSEPSIDRATCICQSTLYWYFDLDKRVCRQCSKVLDFHVITNSKNSCYKCGEYEIFNLETYRCIRCPTGHFKLNDNKCVQCPVASLSYLKVPDSFRTGSYCFCPPGSIFDVHSWRCKLVKAPYYSDDYSQLLKTCPVDSEINLNYGASTCICKKGQHFVNGSCSECEVNEYSFGDKCKRCPLGSTSIEGSSNCTCSAGFYWNAYSKLCALCPHGSYNTDGGNSCAACPINTTDLAPIYPGTCVCNPGLHWDSNFNRCEPCEDDSVNVAQNECLPCPNGTTKSLVHDGCICENPKIWHSVSKSCQYCPQGYYKSETTDECLECSEHSVSATGQTSCLCYAGYQWLNGDCLQCAMNEFSIVYSNQCQKCPNGSASTNPPSDICKCRSGFEWDNKAGVCSTCSFSCYNDGSSADCRICPPYTIPSENKSSCEPCRRTMFWNNYKCLQCPKLHSCNGLKARPCNPPLALLDNVCYLPGKISLSDESAMVAEKRTWKSAFEVHRFLDRFVIVALPVLIIVQVVALIFAAVMSHIHSKNEARVLNQYAHCPTNIIPSGQTIVDK